MKYRRAAQVEGSSMHELAVNVLWDGSCWSGSGARTCREAVTHAQRLLGVLATPAAMDSSARPMAATVSEECLPAEGDWGALLGRCLAELNDVHGAASAEADEPADGGIPRSAIQVLATPVRVPQAALLGTRFTAPAAPLRHHNALSHRSSPACHGSGCAPAVLRQPSELSPVKEPP